MQALKRRGLALLGVSVLALLAVAACKVKDDGDETTTPDSETETVPTSCLEADIAVGESGVYFATSSGEIMRAALAGGEPESIAVEQKRPSGVAVHGRAVYWVVEPDVPSSMFSRGAIMKLSPVE